MARETVALVAGIITAIVGIFTVLMTHYLTRKREDRSRAIERQLERCARQIEEFYGPLYNIVRQIVIIFETYQDIKHNLNPDQYWKAELYLKEHFFFPLHDEAFKILKTCMHLVPDTSDKLDSDIFNDLYKYVTHVKQERIFHELNVRAGVPAQGRCEGWPWDLWGNLEKGLDRARKQQENLLQARMRHVRGGRTAQRLAGWWGRTAQRLAGWRGGTPTPRAADEPAHPGRST